MSSALITAEHLKSLRGTGAAVRVLDVRWTLQEPDGRDDYLAGHIPGAVYVDLDSELAAHGRPATAGRHPLPDVDALQATVRRLGIDDGDTVVAYDDWNNMAASRAWWLLTWAGLGDVRVLNGGLGAWREAGFPLDDGDVVPQKGTARLSVGQLPTLDMDAAADVAAHGILIDSRAPERYRGETEPMDPRAGHIPGAVNIPSASYLRDGRFLPGPELRQLFARRGIDADAAVGTYCGSGITAAHTALALSEAGITAAVFPGSWSAWSNHPDRPVTTGQGRRGAD